MLLVSRSMDLWKIYISSFCLIDKLSYPSFSIFSFLFLLPISCSSSQIIKELCFSSSHSFYFQTNQKRMLRAESLFLYPFLLSCHFRRPSFNGTMKEPIFSQNMTSPIGFFYVEYYLEVSSSFLYVQEHVH